jgi:A/G-specific adenine glycosylase
MTGIPNTRFFTTSLISWHAAFNTRSLPWKNEKDPYKIWLSEVILQQTRALQGLPYYLKFIEVFPSVEDMAGAEDDVVFRLWQGLGYYNRCKNMLATARYIAYELNGAFPDTYDEIIKLKGIGPYTAAAIASFAYGLPHAVVDGNVYRVLSRFFRIDTPFDTNEGKTRFALLAQQLLDVADSAAYNQAIMDLGATVCTPAKPVCDQCSLQAQCLAYRHNVIDLLPVKSKKLVVRTRYFHYLLLEWEDKIWIQKRAEKDIWENLHQPFLIESDQPMDKNELLASAVFTDQCFDYSSVDFAASSSQRLTHQVIAARFFYVHLLQKPDIAVQPGEWMLPDELKKMAFPKTVLSFLEKKLYF